MIAIGTRKRTTCRECPTSQPESAGLSEATTGQRVSSGVWFYRAVAGRILGLIELPECAAATRSGQSSTSCSSKSEQPWNWPLILCPTGISHLLSLSPWSRLTQTEEGEERTRVPDPCVTPIDFVNRSDRGTSAPAPDRGLDLGHRATSKRADGYCQKASRGAPSDRHNRSCCRPWFRKCCRPRCLALSRRGYERVN